MPHLDVQQQAVRRYRAPARQGMQVPRQRHRATQHAGASRRHGRTQWPGARHPRPLAELAALSISPWPRRHQAQEVVVHQEHEVAEKERA